MELVAVTPAFVFSNDNAKKRYEEMQAKAKELGGDAEKSFQRCVDTLRNFAAQPNRRVVLMMDFAALSLCFNVEQPRVGDVGLGRAEWNCWLHGGFIWHPSRNDESLSVLIEPVKGVGEWSLHT